MKKEVDFNIFKAQILDQTRLSGIPQCPQKMDDACPEPGHYLTTTCDKV